MAEGSLHMVVFPWLAFGHMIPFLELSKSLAKRGHHISFLSTPRNILRLPKPPPSLAPLIDYFIPIHLPPSDDLPNDAEATIDLLPDDVQYLKKACDGLDQPIAKFLEQASPRPDWIIQDFTPHWLPPIAAELHIPCAMFNMFPAYFNAFFYGPDGVGMRRSAEQLTVAPEWIPFPTAAAYRLFEARQFHYLMKDDASIGGVGRRPFRAGRPTVQVHGSTMLHGIRPTTAEHHLGAFRQACRPGRPTSSFHRRGGREDRSHYQDEHFPVSGRTDSGVCCICFSRERGDTELRARAGAGLGARALRPALPLGSQEAGRGAERGGVLAGRVR